MTTTLARSDLKAALPRPQHLIRVTPSAGAHRVAVRAGVSVALPLAALWLTGHITWSMYAAFGAFASLYGRDAAYGARLRMQLQAGAALVLGVTAGTAIGWSPDRRWLAVPVVAACAFLVSLLADRLRWHPAGPLFVVFGAAAVGSHAAAPGQVPLAFAVAAGAALFAVAIGTAGRLRRLRGLLGSGRRADSKAAAPATTRQGWQWTQAGRHGVAVLAAGAAATATGIGHPYWSMVAAVVAVTGADTTARLTRAIHRVVGTLAGVGLAAAILAPHLPVGALIIIVGLLQFATELVVGRNYALAVVCLTPLALTMGTLAQPASTWSLLHDRAIETVLGAVIGMAVSLAAHHAHAHPAAAPAAG